MITSSRQSKHTYIQMIDIGFNLFNYYSQVGNAFVSIAFWYKLHLLYHESSPEFSGTFRLRK